jgi:hypothetical protein
MAKTPKVRHAFRKVNETRVREAEVNTRRFLTRPAVTIENEIPTEFWDNAFNSWAFGRVA